jgi:hypothetical protein
MSSINKEKRHGKKTTEEACIQGYLQLTDGVVQVTFELLWKKPKKIIKRLRRLFKL